MRENSLWRSEMKQNGVGHILRAAGHRGVLLGLLVALLGLAGCGSARPIKYYQLTSPVGSATVPESIHVSIIVRAFEANHLLREDRIVYGWGAQEVGTYENQRWTSPPVELLQEAIVRGLRSSGQFRSVSTARSANTGDFVLSGHLYEFNEVDGSTVVGRLAYDVRLHDRKTGATVWRTSYKHDEVSASKEVAAVVSAMDKNVQQSVQQLQAGLVEYFRGHPSN